ncbi:hypothetical protein [Pseudovibrio sp. SPO723]|uniref:hypothetical protein n=1 Tax=Nesiotobacter zosterae TaxID=392721 RepID=UPI0029C3D7B2|nr:hypothetical protein [Pseudovibrio sp. SPO723]MDX5592604.1 hypothetical protein [Pseudovibrio sp. SPO723]
MKTVPARDVLDECLTPEQKEEVNGRLAELKAQKALDACRKLVDSYMPEFGTYALGELYEARMDAEAAIKLHGKVQGKIEEARQ